VTKARSAFYACFAAILCGSCAIAGSQNQTYDAVATPETTLQAALAAAPANSSKPYRIFLKRGRYYEKLTVTKPNIHLIGEDREETVVTFDAISDTPSPEGGTYGTRGSFTIKITAPGFRAENLTFENSFDYMSNYRKADTDPTRFRNPQGVAVMLDEASDRAVFANCTIRGNQDTLFPNAGRSYFRNCTISGNVDFIFGAGTAVFDRCDIVSLDRGIARNNGYVTAASTHIDRAYGFVFFDSRLLKGTPTMAKGSVHLGRPWHPAADSTAVGAVVFIETWMDDHISAEGWVSMSAVNAKGDRIWFDPIRDGRFFEANSKGPGALQSPTRRQLPPGRLSHYNIARILNGWQP
jgi:pectinesterase